MNNTDSKPVKESAILLHPCQLKRESDGLGGELQTRIKVFDSPVLLQRSS